MKKIIKLEQWTKMGDHPLINPWLGLDGNCDDCNTSITTHGWLDIFIEKEGELKHLLQGKICPGDFIMSINGEITKILTEKEVDAIITRINNSNKYCEIQYCENNIAHTCKGITCGKAKS